MKLHRTFRFLLLFTAVNGFFFGFTSSPFAQTQSPARVSHINDFASVVDERARKRLENILENLQRKTGIQFDVATVQSTSGQDIFDFSRQIARDWDVGARTTVTKSLLLVIAINEKTSFTQFSRTVQPFLPEGTLGEMAQRLRVLLAEGQFNLGVNDAVEHVVAALGRKLAFKPEELYADPTTEAAATVNASQTTESVPTAEAPAGRKRLVKATRISSETSAVSQSSVKNADAPAQDSARDAAKESARENAPTKDATQDNATPAKENVEENAATAKENRRDDAPPTRETAPAVPRTETTPERDEATIDADESEEVELTLTLPLPERIVKLKEFIAANPKSKSKPRAYELLVSAHATLGDKQLSSGDVASGLQELMLAIEDAPADASEKLYAGVIAQIPLNMYLRNERISAFKAAQTIEAKFGNTPARLLGLANFYLGIELGDEAARLAAKAVELAPNSAEAHYTLGLGMHISLRLDEAAAEYKRALDLDNNFRAAQRSLADLNRASGKSDEAVRFYREHLANEPKDKAARTGLILSLLDLGNTEEGEKELAAALAEDPQNVTLLAGAAYWFAAHGDTKRGFEFAKRAVDIEPRYTWSQIALARSLVGENRPLDAERAIRFARQYGKFPTLEYELASVLSAAGLYEEAAEVLAQTFTLKDGEIEARLGGRNLTKASSFMDLLAPERRASLFQLTAADTQANASRLKSLLTFSLNVKKAQESAEIELDQLVASGKEFAAGDDPMKLYRQLFVASRLLRLGKGLGAVHELLESAGAGVDQALDVPAATVAVQADELRDVRARAITGGGTPNIPDAPRNVLRNILRGRIDDLSGWAFFNEDKATEAIEPLRRAVYVLPEGTPAWTSATWHLGAALEHTGNRDEALTYYIKSYKSAPDPVRRSLIEKLYVKVNGSSDGLEQRLEATTVADTSKAQLSSSEQTPSATSAEASSPTVTTEASAPPVEKKEESPTSTTPTESAETKPEPKPETSQPTNDPTAATPEPTPSPSPDEPTTSPSRPSTEPSLADLPANPAPAKRSTLKIIGRVKDSTGAGIANVVVVLISPGGSVMASTTDMEGKFTFTVSPSEKPFRVLPSKDGITFTPIDKSLVISTDDVKDIEFVGTPNP